MPQGGTNIGAALAARQAGAGRARTAAPRTGWWCCSPTARTCPARWARRVDALKDARRPGARRRHRLATPASRFPSSTSAATSSATRRTSTGRRCSPGSTAAGLTPHRRGDRRRVLLPAARRGDGRGGGAHRQAAEERAREPRHRPLRRALPVFTSCRASFSSWREWRSARPGGARRSGSSALGVGLLLLAAPARALGPLEANPPGVERGLKAYDEGRFDDALREFTAAEHEAPGHPALEYNRGNALYSLGRVRRGAGGLPRGRPTPRAPRSRSETSTTWAIRWRSWATPRRHRGLPEGAGARAARPGGAAQPGGAPPQDSAAEVTVRRRRNRRRPPGRRPAGWRVATVGRAMAASPGTAGRSAATAARGAVRMQGRATAVPGRSRSSRRGRSRMGAWTRGSGRRCPTRARPSRRCSGTVGWGGAGGFDRNEAERLLDAMRQNERNLQLWRFQQKKRQRKPDEKDW